MKMIETGRSDGPIERLFVGRRSQVMELTLASGGSVPSHRHDGDEVILVPQQGSCRLQVDDQSYTLRPGEVMCTDGGHDFVLQNDGTEEFRALAMLIAG